ncbi:hypothetical protein BUALT_Bualt05G0052000 [Buddleja alternifolia]|uniref:SnoaL-like domain-containing protein n=1 Tax=Buddleja alternifolia TaxID=168488 RepID=A0AAV6XT69_9LAMI|nr:hypothetical protein BUALT_Bualt05G0052000 [Buddleja alternifolia]
MATSMGFSSFITGQTIWSKRATNHSPHALPMHKLRQTQHEESKTPFQYRYTKRVTVRKPLKLYVVPSSNNRDINTSPLSPAQTIMLFYAAINEKNLKQLNELIAEDCFFEDYSFTKPFQGNKEALRFLNQLTSCMGQNMQFNVEHICEGNDYTAGVNWHLDWNTIQVPFTRGCSFYSLSIHGDKLVIKKAQVLVESPIKLGGTALGS